ncbi:MAG: GNAT family N-acetyltransferase [Armatimonadetes bacterium]|nr:GNAT family N-acetyltransferase [Armatimonadota bacterium]
MNKAQPSTKPGFSIHWSSCPLSDADGSRALWFLEGSFGVESDIYLGPTMKGLYEDQSRNWFFWMETEGKIVSICWYLQPDDDPSLSCFGEVYTAPEYRGRGLTRELNGFSIRHFEKSGGKLMMLATGNPVAAKLYASLGFEPHPEGFMPRFTPGCEGFLEFYFSPGEVTTRQVRYGDMPRVVALLNEPNPWISACMSEGIFSPNWYRHNRCGSLFAPLWRRTKGLWMGMFAASGAMVGSVTMDSVGSMDTPGHVILDLFVHPAFIGDAPRLLRDAISFAEDRGVTSFGAYISGWDEKAGVLEREGFERVLPDAFEIYLGDTTQPVGYWRLG